MLDKNHRIIIDRRFCGPPNSGNGGYVCGLMARFIEGAAQVTLRRPPPLERPLEMERTPEQGIVLRDGETIVAEAGPASLEFDVPDAPTYAQAQAAARCYRGFDYHPFPTCFVCGPERAEDDGLRIFAGRVPGGSIVAAPWVPDPSLADPGAATIRSEFLWAALDCPGYFASLDDGCRPMVLGRMAARVGMGGGIRAGERCVVVGWPISSEGRKHYAGTALFSESGELVGQAKATWIELRPS